MFLTEKKPNFPSFSPFRSVTKRPSPHDFDLISKTFDENIIRRLKSLIVSTSYPPSISLAWISLAVDFLSSTHSDAQKLISELTSASGSSDDSRSFYLDHSVKILDICNSISSEIEKLRHRRLLMNFVIHLLEFPGDGEVPAPEKLKKASESIADWEKNGARGVPKRRGFEVREPEVLIRELAAAIVRIAPRGKTSSVGKAVLRTIYAVGLITLFVAGVAASALYGQPEISKIRVPAEFLWADSVNGLQSAIFDGERRVVLSEIDDVATRASSLRELIDGGFPAGDEIVNKGRLKSAVEQLETATENLSEGLDRLADGVDGFFRIVLSTRNGVLENYRVGPHEKQRK